MNQIQELRTSVGEKTETIDTLRQELQDINVSSVTVCGRVSSIAEVNTQGTCEVAVGMLREGTFVCWEPLIRNKLGIASNS